MKKVLILKTRRLVPVESQLSSKKSPGDVLLMWTSEVKQFCTGKKCTNGAGLQGKGGVLSGTKLR